ncbi:MAG: hypothetical protein H7230_01075 [Candidatus Parcubacteria bacterium]|nr:hypothetical protein [Candidatus Paceibacterota bacterium]
MSIAFIHSLLRNFILYFGPIIIISASLILSVANADLYKLSLNQNNFYSQVAAEFGNLKPADQNQKNNPQNDFYSQLIWNNIDSKLNSPDWLKKVTETNLDRANLWVTGKSQIFEPYLPLNENKANPQNTPEWWTNVTDGSTKALNLLQDQVKKLNLPSINIPPDIKNPKLQDNLRDNLKNVENLNPVNQINQTWLNIWNGLRNYYWQLQNLAWTAIILYSLVLIGLILTSFLFGKKPLIELAIIAQRLGFNLLQSSLFFVLSLSGVFLVGAVIKNFIPSTFLIGNVASIINWQIIWIIVTIVSPAFAISIFLIITGLVTKLISPIDSRP